MSTEADARMVIDKLLEAAGWYITNKAQVSTEEAISRWPGRLPPEGFSYTASCCH